MTVNRITARRVQRLRPGSADWLKLMTGSKIAAVLGLSPWESRFSLWHRMAGTVEPEPQTDEQARGHYLEPVVCQWWADQHPEYQIRRAPTFVHRHRKWQAASPDRIATARELHDELIRILSIEAKSDAGGDGWGEPGTEEIPVYYRCQAIWTMDVLGVDECRMPVILPRLEFAEYVVKYNRDEAEFMRAEAWKFLATLESGEQPNIDEHNQTYRVIQQMHPDIEDGEPVRLPAELEARYLRSYADLQDAKADEQLARSEVAAFMGSARRAVDAAGDMVAIRVPGRGNNPPYVKYAGPKVGQPKGIAA